jgi:hypothetical protein
MLLIYPPGARCSEPPLGIARIAAFLKGQGREARCLDLCREGIEYLLGVQAESEDGWTRGALRRRRGAAEALRDISTFGNRDRYGKAVRDLNRSLRSVSRGLSALSSSLAEASLADYREEGRSPLRKADLEESARRYRESVFFPLFEGRLAAELAFVSDGLVGISICYLSQALCAFAIAGYVKATRPDLRIAIGGGLVTSWTAGGAILGSETFGSLVDYVLPGPGEDGLRKLLGLEARGVAVVPDFSELSSSGYLAPARIMPYNFSFGCPWRRCSFCPEKAEGQAYRGASAPAAMAGLRSLARDRGPGLFHLTDNEISPLYLRALAREPPGAPWYGFARFNRLLLDAEFCRSLADSGCVMLQLGLESGDQSVLDAMGKGTRVEDMAIALSNLSSASIGVYLYALFGTPSEDRDAALRTRDFIAERAGEIDFLNVALFNLPASGEEAAGLETRDFYEGELSLYREFRHPKGWDRPRVRDFLSREFDSVPEIREIERRTPPVFTSSHAPFFLMEARRSLTRGIASLDCL